MVLVEGRQPAVRRVRQHQRGVGGGHRGDGGEGADLGGALPERACRDRRPTGSALSPDGTRAARGERRQQHGGRGRRPRAAGAAWSRGSSRPAGTRRPRSSASDGEAIFVLSGKGLTSAAEPARAAAPACRDRATASTRARCCRARCRSCRRPTPATLQAMTKTRLRPDAADRARACSRRRRRAGASPIPRKVGDPSPIKHVFYIIRENRTYDQVLGDLERGNGDPNLCLFGEDDHAQRARHRARVRAARQLLRRRRGELRRPRVLDRRLRDRLRREDLADQLRRPRRALPERGRRQDAQPLRQHRRARRTATSGTSASGRA